MVRKRGGDTGTSKFSRLLGRVRAWGDAEEGLSEVTGAIFVLPILGFTIFALVETGVYMRYRIQVEKVLQETAMGIGQDGGFFWYVTSPPNMSEENTWINVGEERLKALCNPSGSSSNAGDRCKEGKPRKITCFIGSVGQSPATVTKNIDTVTQPGMDTVAKNRGQTVKCSTSFPYKPVSPLSTNYATSMGLSGLFNNNINLSASSQTVVGYGEL